MNPVNLCAYSAPRHNVGELTGLTLSQELALPFENSIAKLASTQFDKADSVTNQILLCGTQWNKIKKYFLNISPDPFVKSPEMI